jgi:predicted  nucleic acid-binding Zn-ribbon protein
MQGGGFHMSTRAKVSLASVKKFRLAIVEVNKLDNAFEHGIVCLEKMSKEIIELKKEIRKTSVEMQNSKDKLVIKIREIERNVDKLNNQLEKLHNQLEAYNNRLSKMSPTVSMLDENGNIYKINNPQYTILESRIAEIKIEINKVEIEICHLKQKLDKAVSLVHNLNSHIEVTNSTSTVLEEKGITCNKLIQELEEIKISNKSKSSSAIESLKKIEKIVGEYTIIKMAYDSLYMSSKESNGNTNINIYVNCASPVLEDDDNTAENNVNMQDEFTENPKYYDKQDINEDDLSDCNYEVNHSSIDYLEEASLEATIDYDTFGRVCEYNGRKFGGKYNSYKTRLRVTPSNDPLRGKFEGERGESQYIPSGRTVEGIVVIDLLSKYGLNGIYYRNAEPDFEDCSEAVVKIDNMTEYRYNTVDPEIIGNFEQADIECAKVWSIEKKYNRTDWSPRDVHEYRKENGLTWHEKCDTETMVMVAIEINSYFKHIGGCSECKVRDGSEDNGGFDE